jgi:methionine aminotransferase
MISRLPDAGTTIFAVMTALAREHGAINLAQGFPDFDPPSELMERVATAMREGHNQYAPMPGVPALRQAISRKIGACYGREPEPDTEITITAGATQALFCAIQAIVHPGDEVLLLEPAYDSYAPAIRLAGGIPIPSRLAGPHFRPDWDDVRALLSDKTRLIITNNPHNPTGRVFDESDMLALRNIVLDRQLWLLSDEVYEHLVYDGRTHHSVLADPELYARSLVTFSFGKTFHATGWKMGYVVAPPALTAELRKVHQFNVFSVFTPGQVALAGYMEHTQVWQDLPRFYQAKRDFFFSRLEGAPFKVLPCEGTYFGLLDYSALSKETDREFCTRFTGLGGVALIPLSPFASQPMEDSRLVRVCFAKTEGLLEQAAEKLRNARYR